MIAKTTKEFIIQARKVHKNIYGYSKVKYVNAKTKIRIFCSNHGYFSQLPDNHLNGSKCFKCEKESRRLSAATFIIKSRKVHGNKYDYSKTKYVHGRIKVLIICPKHGKFLQSPNGHLNGYGCQKCGGEIRAISTNDFIRRSRKIHGNKYDYSKTKYINMRTKVLITCRIHGEFCQDPNSHLNGSGCLYCGSLITTSNALDFIKKSKKIHGNKYDYSNVKYINGYTGVLISCPQHGNFIQKPQTHLIGCGCPKCYLVVLKDGTCWSSMFEAWYYLKYLKRSKITFKYNKQYGFGRKRYDFYFPNENKYVELTSFNKKGGIHLIKNINTGKNIFVSLKKSKNTLKKSLEQILSLYKKHLL